MYGNQRVLFVTTDQALMRRVPELLGAESGRWQPLFAPTSDRAWWELVQGPIEAVVWDRQLEGLEVAQFLARVREGFPRIGLLALAPVSTVIAGRGWSGSYGLHELPRHCDAATLVSQLDRAVDLQQILTQERLRSLIGDLRRLPSVPRTYWDLVDAASRPTTGLSEIARIVQCDPAMSLKVLQLVNSAFFGLAQRVTSIQKAVSYLGLDLLKGIVLTAHTFAAFDTMGVESFSIEQFQLCSIRVARLAQKFVPDRMLAEEIFTSALLHDIGELVLAVVEPEKSAAVTERVAKPATPWTKSNGRSSGRRTAMSGRSCSTPGGFRCLSSNASHFIMSPRAFEAARGVSLRRFTRRMRWSAS